MRVMDDDTQINMDREQIEESTGVRLAFVRNYLTRMLMRVQGRMQVGLIRVVAVEGRLMFVGVLVVLVLVN